MESQYFKNPDQKEKLLDIIETATIEQTEVTLEDFKKEIAKINILIEDIEKHFGAVKSDNDLPQRGLHQLKIEFDKSTLILSKQLYKYYEQHPLFHLNMQNYNKIVRQIKENITKLEYKRFISDDEGKSWERKKNALQSEFTNIEDIIKENRKDINISEIPLSEN